MAVVKIPAGLAVDTNENNDGTTAVGFRHAFAALLQQTNPGVPDTGRLGATHLVVTGTGSMSYSVSPGGAVLTRANQGAYVVANPTAKAVATNPADGTNPRIDRIYIWQPDPALDGSTTDPQAEIGVANGTPAASPSLPALPPGALELARCVVPVGATSTSLLTFTNQPRIVGVNVGTVPISQGGTGATTRMAALNALGIYIQPNQPAYAQDRIWLKTSS